MCIIEKLGGVLEAGTNELNTQEIRTIVSLQYKVDDGPGSLIVDVHLLGIKSKYRVKREALASLSTSDGVAKVHCDLPPQLVHLHHCTMTLGYLLGAQRSTADGYSDIVIIASFSTVRLQFETLDSKKFILRNQSQT